MSGLKIFLSSTQRDLQPERDGAEALVKELGHHCLRAETFVAPGCTPEEACRRMADSCDIYVGIFGPMYGFQVPKLGISATEMEYRVACQGDRRKVFIYVKDAALVDDEQRRFLDDVQDFGTGYFRHQKFGTSSELVEQIRSDLHAWIIDRVRLAHNLQEKVTYMERVLRYHVPEYDL